jgi:hypothetical protein
LSPALANWLQALSAWPVAAFLREATFAYASVNAAHILAICLVVGPIATLDLRVLGLFRNVPLSALARPLTGVAATGVLLAMVTGFLLFSVRPAAYIENPAFLTKLALVAVGIANAFVLRANPDWRIARQDGPLSTSVRLGAFASLLNWCAAVLAGRWIGFLQ